ncbi:hypothetical protein AGL38_003411 [Salmonella enterica subsp. enterica]|uniref:Uncharacterized protein n=1 Tax=Salmonella enterica TaxID=28901 RepID=A0A760WJ75_SALER|nr:hypothetical protein [Salmonella enterica]EDS4738584.1 hypothetical protein [Salmonella enterica subsp. enterica serovar Oranienburg]EDT7380297.1 hypothetical protein [Salmonella enterica subsp. enterica]EDW4991446.1 hypothetical protein [Salmonella enterica subsp. enterica serovar Sandiego]EEC0442955.1 hypothetical protein [Salmonella enterica subsp. enterica serovar Cerro]EEJ9160065.1 hypothetical protein [Salmonella enterica subsp. enterica serovar Rubislaw]EGZ4524034.1 hypothetical pro
MTCDAEQVILNFSSPVLGFYFQVGGVMNRVKRLFLMIILALSVSIVSLPAMALVCEDKGGSLGDCALECSGLGILIFPYIFCI